MTDNKKLEEQRQKFCLWYYAQPQPLDANIIFEHFTTEWQLSHLPRWVKASEVPDPGISKWYIVKTDYHAGRCYCSDKYALHRYCKLNKIQFADLEYLLEDGRPPTSTIEGEDKLMSAEEILSKKPSLKHLPDYYEKEDIIEAMEQHTNQFKNQKQETPDPVSEDEIEAMAIEVVPIYPIYADVLESLTWDRYIAHLRMEWKSGYKAALKTK